MRSYLTRRVFRQILHNEPFLHSRHSARLHTLGRRPTQTPLISTKIFNRSFWWNTEKPKRQLKPKKHDPGIVVLQEQEEAWTLGHRSIPTAEVVEALVTYFQSKAASKGVVLDTQVKPILATFKWLKSAEAEEPEAKLSFSFKALALNQLTYNRNVVDMNQESFQELADFLYVDLNKRREEWKSSNSTAEDTNNDAEFLKVTLLPYLRVIAYRCKNSLKAKDVFLDSVPKHPEICSDISYVGPVLSILARQGLDEEIEAIIKVMKEHNAVFGFSHWKSIIRPLAEEAKDMDRLKKWYDYPYTGDAEKEFDDPVYTWIINACIVTGEIAWGQPIFNKLLSEGEVGHKKWETILKWAVASGKSVEEIEKMLEILSRRNPNLSLDIRTFNNLLEVVTLRNDAYMGERFLGLAKKHKLRPNSRTYRLQMDYRIQTGDIEGAKSAYNSLRGQPQEDPDGKISESINKMIVSLCGKSPLPYEKIMDFVNDLTDRKGAFNPETVASLSKVHLERSELHDLIDLLYTHAASFSATERSIIRDVFVNFINDTSDVAQMWDAYVILRNVFPEISRDLRIHIMNRFFAYNRHDMAMHVFGHMRQASLKERRPDAAAYAACFEGLALARDERALEITHNMLRLDSEVEPNTAINNGLMLAYTLRDEPARALEYWEDITYSREGPNYDSICIALRACQRASGGVRVAREIWARLQRLEVEITKELADSYAAALSGKGLVEEASSIIDNLENITADGSKPDIWR
jgi:hypothetical protein